MGNFKHRLSDRPRRVIYNDDAGPRFTAKTKQELLGDRFNATVGTTNTSIIKRNIGTLPFFTDDNHPRMRSHIGRTSWYAESVLLPAHLAGSCRRQLHRQTTHLQSAPKDTS